jgi:uncharacterized protein YjiS (DUF1127 family)
MSMTFGTINSAQPVWTQRALTLFNRYRDALQSRRQRALLRARLSALSDRELHDIGIAQGEIDFVATSAAAGVDPRYVGPPAANSGGGAR